MPLSRCAAEFFEAGFVIERLVEPLPVPEMADQYPDYYDTLRLEPGFIAFRLSKHSE
jgi:hypothetical protein